MVQTDTQTVDQGGTSCIFLDRQWTDQGNIAYHAYTQIHGVYKGFD